MRLLALLSCAFLLGWVLSWMYYVTWTEAADATPAASGILPQPSAGAAQTASRADAGKALPEPGTASRIATSASPLDDLPERLRRGEFEAVMARYPVLQERLSESDAAGLRTIIVGHARYLLESGRPQDAYTLLELFLDHEYRDIPALLLMAEIHRASGNDPEAIEVLFQARSHAYTAESIEQAEQAIRSAVRHYDARLQARNDDIARLNLYRRLTQLEPEYSPHFIALADTYLALGNADDARKALALTAHDAAVQAQANDIARRIEASRAEDRQYAAEVSLQALGNQFLVDVVVNDVKPAVLLLDTGASLSVVSPALLQSLGVSYRSAPRAAWFSTAGGRVKAPIVTIERLALGGVAVDNIEVGVIGEFDGGPFDGLLGMNFLRHFEFFIDQNGGKLQLSPR